MFEDTAAKQLIEALKTNEKLSYLDLSVTNFTDEWFSSLAQGLLTKDDTQLKKLTINLDNAFA